MKAILTLIAIILIGTLGTAQNTKKEVKVETITKNVVLTVEVNDTLKEDTSVARLYMYKNSRVKKALAFKTKRNRSKLA